jgi:hypothetical protein
MLGPVRIVVVALLVACTATVHGQKPPKPDDRIPIFVQAGSGTSGFTDPSRARNDSAVDIIRSLARSKVLRWVDRDADAAIILEVLARETVREVNGLSAISGTGQNKSVVRVRLIVGEYTTEFEGISGSRGVATGYADAAGKVVKQLDAWAKENKARLTVARDSAPATNKDQP